MKIRVCAVIVCLGLCAGFATAGESKVTGWRTDGSGLFPDANPPVKWGRRSESVIRLRARAGKPGKGDTGTPIADGVIREWLVLGPVPLPEGFKSFKKEIISGEAAFEPAEDDSYKDLKWKKISIDNSCLDFKSLFGPEKVGKGSPQLVAYAQAWIFSDSQQSIFLNQMSAGKNTVAWFNGKPVGVKRAQPATLSKGWNHLAYRAVSEPGPEKKNNSWYIRPVLFGGTDSKYRTKNIAWATRMPGQGYGGPILVGDRIFVTADISNLLCVGKKSGKVLWIRSNTSYDALPEEKRKGDSPEIKEAGELYGQLQEMNKKCLGRPALTWKFIDTKIKLERKIHSVMKEKISRCEVGSAANTPVCDGTHVYALFGNCVLACYDLDGNRKWITGNPREAGEHGHTSSLVIADGKVIASLSGSMLAFDKDTGKLLWETSLVHKKKITYYKFHSTPCVFSRKSKDYLFTSSGQLIRADDGKSLYFEYFKARSGRCASPVLGKDRIYMNAKSVKFPKLTEDGIEPEITKLAEIKPWKFPIFGGSHMASPLIHGGLMYCVSIDGLLSVIDIDKREIVYQKILDLDLNVSHSGSAIRAGIASSPALAGKYIYLFGNQGACLIIKPGRKYEQVAKNRIEHIVYPKHWRVHQEITITCPVFEKDRIYIRGDANLYCIREKR